MKINIFLKLHIRQPLTTITLVSVSMLFHNEPRFTGPPRFSFLHFIQKKSFQNSGKVLYRSNALPATQPTMSEKAVTVTQSTDLTPNYRKSSTNLILSSFTRHSRGKCPHNVSNRMTTTITTTLKQK